MQRPWPLAKANGFILVSGCLLEIISVPPQIQRHPSAPLEIERRGLVYNGHMQQPFPNGLKRPFGFNGCVTAVAAGQSPHLILVLVLSQFRSL
jgi:hypothetical protein